MTVKIPEPGNYRIALDSAWDRLGARAAGQIAELGAVLDSYRANVWRLPVLNVSFVIDLPARGMFVAASSREETGPPVGVSWSILALHYLLARLPVSPARRDIAFEDIPDARGYAVPYRGRVIGRFCGTAGRTREGWRAAADSLGAGSVEGGDEARRFDVFPLVPLKIVWFAGDSEFPPGASFVYRDNIASILSVEDIVVTAEQVVSRLCGKPW
jgi:hypothetical protein